MMQVKKKHKKLQFYINIFDVFELLSDVLRQVKFLPSD